MLCRGIVGDLYLSIHVKEKQGFRREGLNLYSDIGIDYAQAILGTTVKVYLQFSLTCIGHMRITLFPIHMVLFLYLFS